MATGVARKPIALDQYRDQLERRLGKAHEITYLMIQKAKARPKTVVFPEGEHEKILRAAHNLLEEKIAFPILLGAPKVIAAKAKELGVRLEGAQIVDPYASPMREAFIQELFRLRQRRGVTMTEAHTQMKDPNVFGSMMVHMGDADALVSGVSQHYPETIRPALQIIGTREGLRRVAGCYVMITRSHQVYVLADATVNIEPSTEDLAEIALCAAHLARRFDLEPRVAMLSFSTFGSTKHPQCEKVRKAVELIHKMDPALVVDGEVMADVALSPELLDKVYSFSSLTGGANVLIFPELSSANIGYKLLGKLGGCRELGPILMGMRKPVHVLSRDAEVEEIVNIAAIAVVDAQENDSLSWPAALKHTELVGD
jgi:malate dehydrogenase (oxaloacetate-decarboxylating)(NADP+)